MTLTRRQWLEGLGAGLVAGTLPAGASAAETATPANAAPLALKDFAPRSMLHVPETHVPRARFPVIDVHAHLSNTRRSEGGVALGEEVNLWISAADALTLMDRRNVRCMVNLTGGHGAGLKTTIAALDQAAPGRLLSCVEPSYEHFLEPNYPQLQADAIVSAAKDGARGLKVLKTLGLYLREHITTGPLVKVDDARFDPMWEACAAMGLPVFIHTADPEAFFLPIDRFNERYDELGFHPDWSFYGRDFRASRNCWRRVTVCTPAIRARSSYPCTSGTTPRTWPRSAPRWTGFPTRSWNLGPASANLGASRGPLLGSSTGIRTGSCLAPTPCRRRRARNFLSRFSRTSSMKSISDFWNRPMSTLTTRRRLFRRRGAGASTDWRCPSPF